MAIGRLSMKVGKVGKAGPHAAYIAREGKYAARLDRNEKLEATESGNMPAWAKHCPQEFWSAADSNERKNGTTYREMEIALPRELSPQQRVDLVQDFVRQEIGDRHAYQWAIHSPKAADGGEQPHLHLMFSERQHDHIERDPEHYFKRYNSKNPAIGGARKGYGASAGLTLSLAERKTELRQLRDRWEKSCNAHLEQAGVTERIDMRSHAERNTGLMPERKYLPSEWREPRLRAKVIEFRQARRELYQSRGVLQREVPSIGAEIISLEKERERRKTRENESDSRSQQTSAAADQDKSQSDIAKSSNNGLEIKWREQTGRLATSLSLQKERRESPKTMRQGGDRRGTEKAVQVLRDQKERDDQEVATLEKTRRMEPAKRDEQDRLINQLQREMVAEPTIASSTMAQLKAQAARQGHVKTRGNELAQNVVAIEQMKAMAVEKGYLKDQAQIPHQDRPKKSDTLEKIRVEARSLRTTKDQKRNEQDMDR